MNSVLDFILLIVGFICLIKGADYFVEGSSSLAKIMRIPTVIIGLTIVAMGTSAPEASVSINASLNGSNDIAISNVLGSNMFNSLVVVGVCAAMVAFRTNKDILKRDLPINIGVSVLLFLMMIDGKLGHIEGLILLLIMVGYIGVMIRAALNSRTEVSEEIKVLSTGRSIVYIALGLSVVVLGGNLVVTHATNIAKLLGLSENFIGLTIVALGTSLPELVTSIVATRKNEPALALGNAIGSNIFNIVFILGFSSLLTPMNVSSESLADGIVLIAVAVMMFIFAKTKERFSKPEGWFCIIAYISYTIYLFIR